MAFLKPNANNSGLRGRMAGQVYTGGGEDTIVRGFVKPTQADSPAQQAQEARFTRGTQLWGSLTDDQRTAWTEAAKSILTKNPKRIRQRPISGENYLTALTSKFLQASPGGTVPLTPPAGRFIGDTVAFTLSQTATSLVVSTTGGNAPGIVTEIMVQRLAAAYRKPTPNGYRAKRFVPFSPQIQSTSVPATPGAYSVAVQFVEVATGQTAGFMVLGVAMVALALEDGGLADEAGDEAMAA